MTHSTTRKKRLATSVVILAIVIVLAIAFANYFSDQTWNMVELLRSSYEGFTARIEQPPASSPLKVPMLYSDVDGYAVMSSWKRYWAQQHVVVVRQELKPDANLHAVPDENCIPAQLRTRYTEALKDFQHKWQLEWILENRFSPASEFMVVPERRLLEYEIRSSVPANAAGYFAFSAVGFNNQRDSAVIYVVHRDGHYGHAELFLMKKTSKGTWQLDGNGECGWIT